MSNLFEIFTVFLSSVVTALLSYLRFSVTAYQQIIVLLMVLFIVVFGRLIPTTDRKEIKIQSSLQIFTLGVLFVSSLFVQLLVISTGGFYSPFLVMFHFYILGLSFLVNLRSSISFLIFGLGTLGFDLYLNPDHLALLLSDPGTALIYITSFIVIIPFAHFIASKYHVKDEIAKLLTKQVRVGDSILESLSELVIVTDLQLRIISVNEAFKKILNLDDSEIIGKSFFEVMALKDLNGNIANLQNLSIDRVMIEKTTRIIKGFFLYIPNKISPHKVVIQARPILDTNEQVEKLTFVINESDRISRLEDGAHSDLERSFVLQQQRFAQLKNDLKSGDINKLETEIELIKKIEEDISLVKELEDHSIMQSSKLINVALLANQQVATKQSLAKSLGVLLNFKLPDSEVKERSLVNLSVSGLLTELPLSEFSIPIDARWLGVLISKLLEIAILVSSTNRGTVTLTVSHFTDVSINIAISFDGPNSLKNEEGYIFNRYFEGIKSTTNLGLGSGLEGYIAKSILTQLNIPLSLTIDERSRLLFLIELSRLTR